MTEKIVLYPLGPETITTIRNWKEWKGAWNITRSAEIRYHLLHDIFNVWLSHDNRAEELTEQVFFLLDLADGFDDPTVPKRYRSVGNESRFHALDYKGASLSEICLMIARKAFGVLCENFFQHPKSSNQPRWYPSIKIPGLLDKVLLFFRPMFDSNGFIEKISNIPRNDKYKHYEEIVHGFLMELCWYAFAEGHEEDEEFFRPYQVRLIEILVGLEKVEVLLGKSFYELKPECLSRLNALVLLETLWLQNPENPNHNCHRLPIDLLEAVFAKSKLANVCLVLNNRALGATRHQKIIDAFNRRGEAQFELDSLQKTT